MVKIVSHIVISLIVVLGLTAQVALPHHHHNKEICFAKKHLEEKQVHAHNHSGSCVHDQEDQASCSHEQDDSQKDCCFVKNMNYVNPQTYKETIKIKEIDLRFLNLFILNEDVRLSAFITFIPKYEPPEHIYPGYYIVQDLGFRGPPFC